MLAESLLYYWSGKILSKNFELQLSKSSNHESKVHLGGKRGMWEMNEENTYGLMLEEASIGRNREKWNGVRKDINLKDEEKERTKMNLWGQESFEQFIV